MSADGRRRAARAAGRVARIREQRRAPLPRRSASSASARPRRAFASFLGFVVPGKDLPPPAGAWRAPASVGLEGGARRARSGYDVRRRATRSAWCSIPGGSFREDRRTPPGAFPGRSTRRAESLRPIVVAALFWGLPGRWDPFPAAPRGLCATRRAHALNVDGGRTIRSPGHRAATSCLGRRVAACCDIGASRPATVGPSRCPARNLTGCQQRRGHRDDHGRLTARARMPVIAQARSVPRRSCRSAASPSALSRRTPLRRATVVRWMALCARWRAQGERSPSSRWRRSALLAAR